KPIEATTSARGTDLKGKLCLGCDDFTFDRDRLMSFPRRYNRCKKPAVMHGGSEPMQRLEMLRHAVALVGFETIARAILRQLAHQPVARDLGDDRRRRDRDDQSVAADHGFAVARR